MIADKHNSCQQDVESNTTIIGIAWAQTEAKAKQNVGMEWARQKCK